MKSQSIPKTKSQPVNEEGKECETGGNNVMKQEKIKKTKIQRRNVENDELLSELNEILRCGSGSSNEETLCSGLDDLNIKIEY